MIFWSFDCLIATLKTHFKTKKPALKELALTILWLANYISMLAYLAFFSMNSLLGGTSSPMSIENTLSASEALAMFT